MSARAFGIGIVLAALVAAAPLAQRTRWAGPYKRGIEELGKKNWDAAIRQFDAALRADPKPEANKLEEGAFRSDYFPYLYRGIAYTELGEFDKAQADLKKAAELAGKMSTKGEADLAAAQKALANAMRPVPPPTPPPTPRPTSTPSNTPTPGPTNTQFANFVRSAQTAYATSKFADAVGFYEDARRADPDAFRRGNLQPRLEEALRGQARDFVTIGQKSLQEQKLGEAKARFAEANALVPNIAKAELDAIEKRESDYKSAKDAGERQRLNKQFQDALKSYAEANTHHPELYRADNLGARVAEVNAALAAPPPTPGPTNDPNAVLTLLNKGKNQLGLRRFDAAIDLFDQVLRIDPKNADASKFLSQARTGIKYEDSKTRGLDLFRRNQYESARTLLLDAKDFDGDRFVADGLGSTIEKINTALAKIPPPPPSPVAGPLNDALVAYLKGDVASAIALLEPPAANDTTLSPQDRADVHAYLGVAYADRAFGSREDADRQTFRTKAIGQFKLALKEDPNYQLSGRLGPQVQRLLNEARGK